MRESETRRRRGRPSRADAGEGRAAIKKAALMAFAKHGFKATSIDQIAKAAGVAKPLVHYHFKSKDDLWRQAVADGFDLLRDDVVKLAMELQLSKPDDAVAAFALAIVRTNARHPQIHQVTLDEARQGGPRADWVRSTYIVPMIGMLVDALVALEVPNISRTDLTYAAHLIPAMNGAMNFPFIDATTVSTAFNVDVFSDDYVTQHAAFVTTLIKACIEETSVGAEVR